MTSLEYNRLQQILDTLGITQQADEYHGALCGMLCHGAPQPDALVFDEIRPDAEAQSALASFAKSVLGELEKPEFEPLLPDDDLPLMQRVQALANWCGGFLYGLGTQQGLDIRSLSDEVQELVNDFTQISRAGLEESDDAAEEDERAYMELVEYVRVGAQLIFLELHPPATQPSAGDIPGAPPTLH